MREDDQLEIEGRNRLAWGSLLLLLATILVYLPVWRAGFIWDDDVLLTDNALIKASDGLRYIWFSTRLPDYFPLTMSSLWLEWRLWGLQAAGYHVTNVLLHGLAAFCYLRSGNRGSAENPRRSFKWYWLGLGCFLLALLSKTGVVMLPVVLLACAWWRHGRLTPRVVQRVLPFFALALVLPRRLAPRTLTNVQPRPCGSLGQRTVQA